MICGVPTLLHAYLRIYLYISLLRNPQRGEGVTSRLIPNWYVPVGLVLEGESVGLDAGSNNLEGTYGRGCGRAASQELGLPREGVRMSVRIVLRTKLVCACWVCG